MLNVVTNTLSYFMLMRGEGNLAQRLAGVSPRQVALPAIVVFEVCFGLQRAGRQAQLAGFAAMVQATRVLDFDAECAAQTAGLRAHLEALGTPIGPHDLLIAATACRYKHTLVTHNTCEFARVPGLVLEDWFAG